MTSPLVLRPLTTADEAEAWVVHDELAREGFDFLLDGRRDDWAGYLTHLADEAAGVNLGPGRVPATFLVAEVDGMIVGRVSVRHELNDALAHAGGHVGYQVRQAYRRRGYATEMLRRSLAILRSRGVERALVTAGLGLQTRAREQALCNDLIGRRGLLERTLEAGKRSFCQANFCVDEAELDVCGGANAVIRGAGDNGLQRLPRGRILTQCDV